MTMLALLALLQAWSCAAEKQVVHARQAYRSVMSACPDPDAPVNTLDDLIANYCNIFPTNNRNAASFKWFKFLADRAAQKTEADFLSLSKGYCPISGSPIPGTNIGKVTLNKVGGGTSTGYFHFCCSPCICDLTDWVHADTKMMTFADGVKSVQVLVLGDPCKHSEKLQEKFVDPFSGHEESLQETAPEIVCQGDVLQGTIFSDGGYPIIGIFYQTVQGNSMDGTTADVQAECDQRASSGYASGMGQIFRKVAMINPITQ